MKKSINSGEKIPGQELVTVTCTLRS